MTELPLRDAATRIRRTVASPTSGALAYTCFCIVTLLFALCLDRMPDRVLVRVAALAGQSSPAAQHIAEHYAE